MYSKFCNSTCPERWEVGGILIYIIKMLLISYLPTPEVSVLFPLKLTLDSKNISVCFVNW